MVEKVFADTDEVRAAAGCFSGAAMAASQLKSQLEALDEPETAPIAAACQAMVARSRAEIVRTIGAVLGSQSTNITETLERAKQHDASDSATAARFADVAAKVVGEVRGNG
jgi:hypothetical protein